MIGSLRGRLTRKHPPNIVLECAGVGYELETPMSTFLDLPEVGSDLFLYTHLQVREDAQTLFAYIVGVALTKSPTSWLRLLAG